ncbi:hypothetical protein [Polyangium jinanense]|uniref:Uncharacterized protein n=1 Tax=Polyangium jinanense TaxID=2829994 RepID=A0A9X4AU12_9BACT|nr:hypothetical protein [Polyangium jinanense]MDC3957345.1 hypothetical protein [Polyangium jinanense]MDC3982747.1 hypothetical protein [Polyangium jinanense]
MTVRSRAFTFLGGSLLAAGCGAGEPPHAARPKPPPPAAEAPPQVASPAHWSFHPPMPASATATLALEDGGCLITTAEGHRFRAARATKDGAVTTCRGRAEAAPDVAPEAIVGITPQGKASWLFVGQSGRIYEAEGPLAPIKRTIAAPARFVQVASGGRTVLGATASGELFHLDEGPTWKRVAIVERVFDVAVSDDGQALALALPEALLTSDDGKTFQRASSAAPIGARRVGRTAEGHLAAQGMTGTLVWDPRTSATFTRRDAVVETGPGSIALEISYAPSASSVLEGRAVLDGDRYLEVVLPEDGEDYTLLTGPLEGPLAQKRLPGTSGCTSLKLGAREKHVALGCMKRSDDDSGIVEVRTSHDDGAHFSDPLVLSTGEASTSLVVSSDGSTLVAGACKAHGAAATSNGCTGSSPLLVRREGAKLVATVAETPSLSGAPVSPAFSVDGRSAYFLARRGKDERLALYVSHDGGETFSERTLDVSRARRDDGPSFEEGDEVPAEEADADLDPRDQAALRPGDDGTVGLTLLTPRGLAYVTTDDDGRLLGVARPPSDPGLVGGAGRHAVAFSVISDRPHGEQTMGAWESLDGGTTWTEIPATQSLTREIAAGPLTLVCSGAGCLVGDTMSRVGWNGQAEPFTTPPAGPPEPHRVPSPRTPIVCELDPRVNWTRIEDVDPIHALGLPGVDQLARGRSLWSVLSFDPRTNAVTVTTALGPERGEGEARVITRPLLGPAPQGAEVAMEVSHQTEGYAVARVRLPPPKSPEGPRATGPMRDVELAWENFMEGTTAKVRLPDAGAFTSGDVKADGARWQLDTALISVTPGALFLRPHAPESRQDLTFLLDPKGKQKTFPYPTWSTFLPKGVTDFRMDAVLADGKPLAVATLSDDDAGPLTFLLARQGEGGTWSANGMSLAPGTSPDGERLARSDWSYIGSTTLGDLVVYSEPRAGFAAASFHAFRNDGTFGPAIAIPTPFDLPDLPRACKPDERRTTPRFAAHAFLGREPMYPGRRHAVLVSESSERKPPLTEPMTLLTAGVVLHGTKESPCVAAWEAIGLGRIPTIAVLGGNLAQSWVFRPATPKPPPSPTAGKPAPPQTLAIEYRPMTCRFDPAAKVPEGIDSQPGTYVWAP